MQMKQIIGILAIIGAIIMMIGVFVSWMDVDILVGKESYSGWKFLTDFDADGFKDIMLKYAPLMCLIAGILTILIFIANFVSQLKVKYLPVISLIVTILALIFTIIGLLDINDLGGLIGAVTKAGIGIYICIIGCILAIIAPIIALIKREDVVGAYAGAINDATGKE